MSVQKYMHPRNIYRTRPSFKQLAIEFPEFKKYITLDVSGKVSLNFKDLEALRALTCTLLKKDFNLNVEIPLDRMIPTVPLRLNYVLWVEDLLSICGKENGEIRGIDIGTGASCIYCLLGAKSKGWHMIGTDINKESIRYAQKNVYNNSLQHLITIKEVKGDTVLQEALEGQPFHGQFDFCMCNPPFFSNIYELQATFKSRRPDRPRPKNGFCATPTETVHEGGEVKFVQKIINESKTLQTKIRIYTTMLGHKSSVPPLKYALRDAQVKSFKETEFCQGNTTRWGLAWTFCDDIDLRKVPKQTVVCSRKQNKPVQFQLKSSEVPYEKFCDKVAAIFQELQINTDDIILGKTKRAFCFDAYINTWSHQRKKRRYREHLNKLLNIDDPSTITELESEKKDSLPTIINDDNPQNGHEKPSPTKSDNSDTNMNDLCDNLDQYDANMFDKSDSPLVDYSNEDLFGDNSQGSVQQATDLISNIRVSSPKKREYGEDDDPSGHKKTRNDGRDVLVKGVVSIMKEKSDIVLQMNYLKGSAGKEGVNQILQYIKNNWNK